MDPLIHCTKAADTNTIFGAPDDGVGRDSAPSNLPHIAPRVAWHDFAMTPQIALKKYRVR